MYKDVSIGYSIYLLKMLITVSVMCTCISFHNGDILFDNVKSIEGQLFYTNNSQSRMYRKLFINFIVLFPCPKK